MAQEYFKLGGVQVKQPDDYAMNLATTSTNDSDRNQYLVMKNTPIGTVDSYSLKWKWLTPAELSAILAQVLNKPKFAAHYFDGYLGAWTDGTFYASNYNTPAKTLKDGVECWDELSFDMVGINPI